MTEQEAIYKLVNAEYADKYQGDEELMIAQHMAIDALDFKQNFFESAKQLLSSDYNDKNSKLFWSDLLDSLH